ncbi:response regulator [Paenibacillus harenae]|uniref:Two-component system response regulator YesN n=1 Tax=Paenibacillus harenae TaxID=306543 RepID=A0ABT9TU80_PAEHA|nr:response regulator [Paenibacillus harenae]MDQ0110912.1 two-component system response regulator YesN [Paenibacillus harenae]
MYQLLIVDDQPDLVEDLAHNLPWVTIGIDNVYQAYSGQEAIAIMNETPIDIVITDIHMPGLSGLELIEQIRGSWTNVRCILLTGYNDFEYAKRALQQQATDYLLKPAEDEELLQAVKKAVTELEQHWSAVTSQHKTLTSLRENLPVLRKHLLASLLQGKTFAASGELEKKLDMFQLPHTVGSPFCIMLLRMEDYFHEQTERDGSLLEFAVSNIAEEIFSDEYTLWHMKDDHGYLVFLIMRKANGKAAVAGMKELSLQQIESKVAQLQHYVSLYLKGTISLVLSKQAIFPIEVRDTYERCLVSFRQRIGGERGFMFTLAEETDPGEANSLTHLYNPPLLIHLLEAAQWDAIDEKLKNAFEELEHKWGDSHEHILETYFMIASSLSFSVHKNKLWMADIMKDNFNQLLGGPQFHTIKQLRSWTTEVLHAYKSHMSFREQDSRSGIVQRVQEYVANRLEDASLQTIAAHVYLNPSYLSKVYKLETGEGISDYLSRLKMEKAAHLLRSSNEKIYEIAAKIGYLKTSYFIKVFKDRYGITPQEFRDR